ncbi:MAG: RNA 2',3'-cyclic phosphodiesterase [Pseudomonadales bacterium]|nr:RNA 2',3'-cyclic phosphodiesterase [Pseudomonadales bacterium]
MRLFFALQPDDRSRTEIERYRQQQMLLTGKPVVTENLHITLKFLGEVKDSSIPALIDATSRLHGSPFRLHADQTGYFATQGISWLGCSEVVPELSDLVRQLEATASAFGIRKERRPYQPHVTLARQSDRPPVCINPPDFDWWFEGFSLFSSRQGNRGMIYTPLGYWALTGNN